MNQPSSFTGRNRDRSTKASVKWADRISRLFITVGGIGTIVAVTFVGLFLLSVSLPLFSNGSSERQDDQTLALTDDQQLSYLSIDEHRHLIWTIDQGGAVTGFKAQTGEVLSHDAPLADVPTSLSAPADTSVYLAGYADGSVQEVTIRVITQFKNKPDIPESYHDLVQGEERKYERGVVTLTPKLQYRIQKLEVTASDPLATGVTAPIVRLNHAKVDDDSVFVAQYADGSLMYGRTKRSRSMMTGKIRTKLVKSAFEIPAEHQSRGPADHIMIDGLGTNFYLAWQDGFALRYNAFNTNGIFAAEEFDLVPSEAATVSVTALRPLLGRISLLVGDSAGDIHVWHPAKPDDAPTEDGTIMMRGHHFTGEATVTAFLPPFAVVTLLPVMLTATYDSITRPVIIWY